MNNTSKTVALALTLVLAACGGGGGDTSNNSNNNGGSTASTYTPSAAVVAAKTTNYATPFYASTGSQAAVAATSATPRFTCYPTPSPTPPKA